MARVAAKRPTLHGASIVALAVALALLGTAGDAVADSSFQLTHIEPTKLGAKLFFAFDNNWGSTEENQANALVWLFGFYEESQGVWPFKPNKRRHRASKYLPKGGEPPGGIPLGGHRLLGTGVYQIELPYAELGLEPGKPFFVTGLWHESDHVWGLVDRSSGSVVLPRRRTVRRRRKPTPARRR